MAKKIVSILVSFLVAVPIVADTKKDRDIDLVFRELLKKHETFLNQFFEESSMGGFERAFYSDMGFSHNFQTVNFFENLKTNLDMGNTPRMSSGFTRISYTSYSNINGVPSAISYDYRSDGKNIVLTKGTLKNGQMLKAVYQYDVYGKQLETKEFHGKSLLSNRTYKYEI